MTILFTIAAYIGPLIVALAVTQEIADAYSGGINPGPNGNLWFTESGGNRIERFSPGSDGNKHEECLLPSQPHLSHTALLLNYKP